MTQETTNNDNSKPNYNIPNGRNIGEGKVVAIKAMKQLGLSNSEIATRVKVSKTTVHFIGKSEIYNPAVIERIKKYASANFWLTQHNALAAITPEKLEASSARDLSIIAGISTEKARLIDGDSTVNVGFIDKSDGEIQREIDELELQLARANALTVVENPTPEIDNAPLEELPPISSVDNQVITDTDKPTE